MSDDPTDTPEPTAEEWRIAQEIDLRYPTTDAYAHTLARYRVRVQRETVGRARVACGAVFAEFADAARDAADERTKAAKLEGAGAAAVCDTRIATLDTDAPESLEALLERARALGDQLGLEEISPGEWEACINVEQRGDRPGYLHTATGPTPHAALRALLQEDDDAE